MFDLLKLACDIAARAGCQFADARYLDIRGQRLSSRDHALSGCNDSEDSGFGVRVLYRGAWGFASSPCYRADEVERVVDDALGIAKASARALRDGGKQFIAELQNRERDATGIPTLKVGAPISGSSRSRSRPTRSCCVTRR